ncbi:uncharacterized protein LOC112572489 [Pomacea canaliculata]|uniref:uncharacterized protein LOC112572489 n=1 Tax=Pomacea canaliculata TaxID=400727 RepID=UPI000D72EF59|nr:uncharacterized protein LOC112572489 [Pomacea canaliculata]
MGFLCLGWDSSCLACLLLLTTVCTCEGGGMEVRTWRRFSADSQVYTIQTYSRLVTVASRITCADLCSQTSECHVFYFRSDTGLCFLSPTFEKRELVASTPLTHVYSDGVICPYSTYEMLDMISCVKLYTSAEDITVARQACEADGAKIVTLKTVDKSSLLYTFVEDRAGGPLDIWLDASDAVEENHWVWADGGTLDLTDPMWDSTDQNGGISENCLIAYYFPGIYNYSDVPCDYRLPYVCEISFK